MSLGEMAARLGAVAAIVTRMESGIDRLRRQRDRAIADGDYVAAAKLETRANIYVEIAERIGTELRS